MNLMTNAIQATEMKEGGNNEILVRSSETDNGIEVRIKDWGVGMTEETKSKVFEPFFTTKDVGEGTGLGLSIAYSIVELHNGSIEVESTLGEGTEFIVQLPLKQD